jgi:hypothetical protein
MIRLRPVKVEGFGHRDRRPATVDSTGHGLYLLPRFGGKFDKSSGRSRRSGLRHPVRNGDNPAPGSDWNHETSER